MNGKHNTPLSRIITALIGRVAASIGDHRRMVVIFVIIALLYLFSVVVFVALKNEPVRPPSVDKYSQLYLLEYINGYRDVQQDFAIEDVFFGESFLTFTLNINFRTKSVLIIKKLAVDIILGLVKEYPELESIQVKVIRDVPDESVIIYGRATYERAEDKVAWDYE